MQAVTRLSKKSKDPQHQSDLLQEIKLMKKIHSDENVIRMLGYCAEEAPMVLIMEYASYGNLKTYLKDNRQLFTPGKHESSRSQMLAFATDVANGMKHLQRIKIVHRYLAAKHVLVFAGGICKISNFSYASGVMSDERFFETKMKTQYQWMAPESLMEKSFTLKTDVWSFGVVLWEIFSLGRYPYKHTTKSDLLALLEKGQRMVSPDGCEDIIYEWMLSCWKWRPSLRPSLQSVHQKLRNLSKNCKEYSYSEDA
ncbi:tyrosine-protein kinase SRK3-like [Ptychodera flava]|uniref:tyrosine-protein kinase SRK3-like n=1 Tax=Ptychodera flava TaxID=63121 RepID=UPI00396A3DB5